jgi:hypothetical protein
VTRIAPKPAGESGKVVDMIGVVTALDGEPLPAGAIASRLGGFNDVSEFEGKAGVTDFELMGLILGSKNDQHNNYQDFQKFLEAGGKIGLQHDPLLYGAYNLNPFLVRVEQVPMLVVEQGQVAVIKAYVGLPTQDTSGATSSSAAWFALATRASGKKRCERESTRSIPGFTTRSSFSRQFSSSIGRRT